jgi:glycosyltransferase involved in cell wall biosynthesis
VHPDRAVHDETSQPAVSVVFPSYCASHDIAFALDSVFSQTFASFEVIVVNDGSPEQRIVEGNFAAARYHFAAARHRPWRVRAAQLALNISPRLLRRLHILATSSEISYKRQIVNGCAVAIETVEQ